MILFAYFFYILSLYLISSIYVSHIYVFLDSSVRVANHLDGALVSLVKKDF